MFAMFRWWFITCFSILGLGAAYFFGFFSYLWITDITKLSFVTISIFVFFTLFIGILAYNAQDRNQDFADHLPLCWFASEAMLNIGMIGTLIGFLILLTTAFSHGMNFNDTVAMQKMLGGLASGFGTAVLTTLVGLVCSLITKLHLISIEYQLDV